MSIKTVMYQVCKSVISSPARPAFQALLLELNQHKQGASQEAISRSSYGSSAKAIGPQLSGYLVLDQERDNRAFLPPMLVLPPLAQSERNLLLSAHQQMLSVSRLCIQSLLQKYPQCAKSVNLFERLPVLKDADVETIPPFPGEIFEELIAEFNRHPALVLARQTPPTVLSKVSAEQLLALVAQHNAAISKNGMTTMPKNLSRFLLTTPPQDLNRILACLIVSLSILRSSLYLVNQMIYQALLFDKLPVLNEDNIIDVPRSYSALGEVHEIVYQPDAQSIHLGVGEILLVKKTKRRIPNDMLYQSSTLNMRYDRDLGMTDTAQVLVLDDNLDPYNFLRGLL